MMLSLLALLPRGGRLGDASDDLLARGHPRMRLSFAFKSLAEMLTGRYRRP